MIVADTSETREGSRLPQIEGIIECPILEQETGADLLISPIKAPVTTPQLIKMHINRGAILVQRKHGHDLSSSVGTRLNKSLAKMIATGARQSQCVLLFIGFLTCDNEGHAEINKQSTHRDFWVVQAAMSKWHDRGGVVEQLTKSSLVGDWCKMKEKHLIEYSQNPTKQFMPDKPVVQDYSEFFQTLVPVNDARVLLATLPGVGEKTANLIWNHFKGEVGEALCCLTSPHTAHEIKGIGRKTIDNIRDFLNLDEVMVMTMDVDEDLLKEAQKRKELKNKEES